MTAYQLWGRPGQVTYIPCCKACGEYLRSSPTYDGATGYCIRKNCLKARAKKAKAAEAAGAGTGAAVGSEPKK